MGSDDEGPFVRLRGRRVLAQFGSFLRLTAYTYGFKRLSGKDGERAWSGPVEQVDVFRRDAVAGILHLVRDPAPADPEARHTLFFVRQFRFSTTIDAESGEPDPTRDGLMLELMAGVREPGEPTVETFKRETREETGFDLEEVVPIGSFYPSAGACSERIYLYYGRLHYSEAVEARIKWGVDRNEEIERLALTPRQFLAMVERGEVYDAKALIGAEWMRRNLGKFDLPAQGGAANT